MAILTALAARADQPLLRLNQPTTMASFVGAEVEGTLKFRVADQDHQVLLQDFTRWSTPRINLEHHEAILVDGSRLALAESWSGKNALELSGETVSLTTKLLGKIVLPRSKLRAVLLNTPADGLRRTHLLDQLLAFQKNKDQLRLPHGDVLTGKLIEIGSGESPNESRIAFRLDGTSEPISLATNRVAGLVCSTNAKTTTRGKLALGLRDGSYLIVTSLAAQSESWQTELACGVQVTGHALRDILHLQSLGPQPVYLSDQKAIDYRHEPYLEIPWPYRQDRNVLGGPLTVREKIYAKGLSMHTTSWLTYDLSRPSRKVARLKRFAAQIAIDDTAGRHGSVIFQVFLRKTGALQLAFASPIVRGGDLPLPISVELGNAEQIVLVVQTADRGDERDYANWLDARLE